MADQDRKKVAMWILNQMSVGDTEEYAKLIETLEEAGCSIVRNANGRVDMLHTAPNVLHGMGYVNIIVDMYGYTIAPPKPLTNDEKDLMERKKNAMKAMNVLSKNHDWWDNLLAALDEVGCPTDGGVISVATCVIRKDEWMSIALKKRDEMLAQ